MFRNKPPTRVVQNTTNSGGAYLGTSRQVRGCLSRALTSARGAVPGEAAKSHSEDRERVERVEREGRGGEEEGGEREGVGAVEEEAGEREEERGDVGCMEGLCGGGRGERREGREGGGRRGGTGWRRREGEREGSGARRRKGGRERRR
eukprot:2382386-Rhodomonas_salina.1